MRVAVICRDNPGSLSIRLAHRAAHLAHIETSGMVEQAGPFLDSAGEMCGSLLILSVDSMAEAEAWAAADPYRTAGLFADVTLTTWKKVIG